VATAAYHLKPWTHVVRPHDDVTAGALDMGVYAVNLARVFRNNPKTAPVYRDAHRFHAATYLTDKMHELFTDVTGALAGQPGSRVLQLRTPFGGGKSHSLVGLLHLVRDRAGSITGNPALAQLPDPGPVQVAVLSGEELDRNTPMLTSGVTTHTLWGELGAQLGRYHLIADHDRTGAAPGGAVLQQLFGDSPVLILLDEVLVYVEKAMAVAEGDSNAGRQAMLFVQALTEAVNNHPTAVMVYSLQASAGEAIGAEGLLTQLDHLVGRIDAKREPVSGEEILRVVQRRLFAELGDEQVRTEVAKAYAQLLEKHLLAVAETAQARREAVDAAEHLRQRILLAYPFHPELLDLMNFRWGSLPNYQRTRGALQFLACAVHALWRKGSSSALIGPGDVDLSDEATRGAFFTQVGERERYAAVLSADITSTESGATVVDRRLGADSPTVAQLVVGTRMATAVMLYSFGARDGEERGVLETDLISSALTPGLDGNIVLAALRDLREEELYLHHAGRRYRFEPVPNLTKLVRDTSSAFDSDEVLTEIRAELEKQLQGARGVQLWPADPGAISDSRPVFTVAYLHPDWSDARQPLAHFVEQTGKGAPRRYRNAVALVLPDDTQFDRVRQAMRARMASAELLGSSKHQFNPEQMEDLQDKQKAARRDAAAGLALAYRTAVLPVRDREGAQPYRLEEFDLRSLVSAGKSLHERVVDALSARVFSTVTTAKLLSLAGLDVNRQVVSCSDLVDWFYSFYEFVKLWDRRAVADAIARGVANGEVGYVVGLVRNGEQVTPRDKRTVRYARPVSVDEIDLSDDAALLWGDYAQELVKVEPVEPPTTTKQHEPVDNPGTGGTPSADPRGGQTGPTGGGSGTTPDGTKSHDLIRTADISARFRQGGLFGLMRALTKLRELDGQVDLEIKFRVEGEFDRTIFRNTIIEPIDEEGHDVNVQTS
jgi:hypothetical protein